MTPDTTIKPVFFILAPIPDNNGTRDLLFNILKKGIRIVIVPNELRALSEDTTQIIGEYDVFTALAHLPYVLALDREKHLTTEQEIKTHIGL